MNEWGNDAVMLTTSGDLHGSGMTVEQLNDVERVIKSFPMKIPLSYYSLINWDDPEDPIARMCIPSADELDTSGSFDTSGEQENTAQTGLQHKYRQTVLVLTTNVCAVYCRHCFRKRLVGLSESELNRQVDDAVQYVSIHPEVNNVLLSGGDALMLPNHILRRYLFEFSAMGSLDFIRIGSRVPVVFPQRILEDNELVDMLGEYARKKTLHLVTQFNHPREVASAQADAVRCLLHSGVQVRNQTVLLRGVNDSSETLGELLRKMTLIGAAPYYVFQCRPVRGVKSRFQVPLREGAEIIAGAKALQNGFGKSFRFAMSHPRGKIEILGPLEGNKILFKFHQSKYSSDEGRLFAVPLSSSDTWLDEELKGV